MLPPSSTPNFLLHTDLRDLCLQKNKRQPLSCGVQLTIICTHVFKNRTMMQFWDNAQSKEVSSLDTKAITCKADGMAEGTGNRSPRPGLGAAFGSSFNILYIPHSPVIYCCLLQGKRGNKEPGRLCWAAPWVKKPTPYVRDLPGVEIRRCKTDVKGRKWRTIRRNQQVFTRRFCSCSGEAPEMLVKRADRHQGRDALEERTQHPLAHQRCDSEEEQQGCGQRRGGHRKLVKRRFSEFSLSRVGQGCMCWGQMQWW